jgi:copper(I)-binding protein
MPVAVQAQQGNALQFAHAWIRTAPPASPVMAGYLQIRNPTALEMKIESVASDAFGSAELHEMREVNGVMRMRALRDLRLLPDSEVSLAPGGMHLMLMQPVRELSAGDMVAVTFVLANGGRQDVEFEVRADAPSD